MSTNPSSSTPIRKATGADFSLTAPTPQNTPLSQAPISSGLGLTRPGVDDILEEYEAEEKENAKELAKVLQSTAARSALTSIVQQRLAKLVGQSSGYVEGLPIPVKRSLVALHAVQAKQVDLQKDFKKEVWELEKKYLERTKPLYDRRAAIVSGSSAPTVEEIEAGEAEAIKDDEDHERLPKLEPGTNPEKAPIPDFWLNVLRNHSGVEVLLSSRDQDALKHLKDVQLSYLTSPIKQEEGETEQNKEQTQLGFKLLFFFSPNDYFENEVLEKTYLYKTEIDWAGDFQYDHAIGTTIRWKSEDKDLTKDIQTKTQRSKKTNRTRTVKRAVDVESFFKFFGPPQPPSDEDVENGGLDEDDLSEREAELMIDFQLGDDFRDRIIPHAVDYYTGKALEWDDEGSDWEDDDADLDSDIDEEEDEEETDEE
ncbi:NAP-domain-containing protein [Fomitiporia mediterranea MF3/22]|uniref:NAP-domain-containing protein n=1 Tax=Fomitiporia mediterranea (strain MF3/22) TaxID=694068 RepID=UPI0004408126|nr:NAP-domain-containing protein [Fomitiporia mediterranea MF3/22]EJD02514.1 NAP-domain-containing protein [Fomitiporia mediterranea MF3/22]